MNSEVAARFDDGSILQSGESVDGLLRQIQEEYGPSTYGSQKYLSEELYWMGYLYRYWQCTYYMSSKTIYKIIGASELRGLYYAYHTLSVGKSIERIMEEKEYVPLSLEERQLVVMRALLA